MSKKIKVLICRKEKTIIDVLRRRKNVTGIDTIIEKIVPNTYEFSFGNGIDESLEIIKREMPQIVFISPLQLDEGLHNVRLIKESSPTCVVFVFLYNIVDDEQRLIDAFEEAGAYKCYLPPLAINSVAHDMYVSLNIE